MVGTWARPPSPSASSWRSTGIGMVVDIGEDCRRVGRHPIQTIAPDVMDLKDGITKGKLRPHEIQTLPMVMPPSPRMVGDERPSPNIVARLVGLEVLPHDPTEEGLHAACGGELRRSTSERVPRDPSHF